MDPNLTHRQHMKYDEAYLSPYPPIQLTKNTREPDYTQPQHMINDDHYVSPYASSQIQTPTPIQNEASMQSAWSGVFPTPDSATYTYPIPSPYDPSNYSVYPKQTPYDGMQPHHSAFGPPRQPADIGRQQLQDQGQTQNSSWQPWYMLGQQKEVGFAKLAFEDHLEPDRTASSLPSCHHLISAMVRKPSDNLLQQCLERGCSQDSGLLVSTTQSIPTRDPRFYASPVAKT